MKLKVKFLPLFLAIASLLVVSVAFSQNKFKLKPDAKGKLCLSCHEKFKEKLKNQFVHTPVKSGDCSECHNPHAASHGKLLSEDVNKVCFKCHEGVLPKNPKSTHKVVMEGNCVKCHDPHASNNKFVLLKAGNSLCIECHKDIGNAIAKVKFKHSPVEKGCMDCHDPHGSSKADMLLKTDLVSLCTNCHKTDRPAFARQHVDYPVAKANCSSCHDPHGSDKAGLLFANVHAPVANRQCSQCHEAPTSANPFKTKRASYELCRTCHSSMMNETLNKSQIHWPLLDKTGCLNCHEPHASKQKKLLMTDTKSLCGKCHSDTMGMQAKLAEMERQEKSAAKGKTIKGDLTHKPIQEGNCSGCHSFHGSDSPFLMKQASTINLCGTCHDWLKHTSHPMGPRVVDSRNKNLTVDCLSCHRSHGTGYRYLVPFPTNTELCVQCHKQLKR